MKKFGLIDAMIIILFLLAVYFILTRIFGHSATELTISVTLFGILAGLIYKNMDKTSNLNREVGEIKIHMVNSFKKVREDIGEIRNIIKKKR